jgi:hypothetical protein
MKGNILTLISASILIFISFAMIGINSDIDKIRAKRIINNDSVQYIIRNYCTRLAGPSGFSTWKELSAGKVNPDVKYYETDITTSNRNIKKVNFIFKYNTKLDSVYVIKIEIDNITYKNINYSKLLQDIQYIKTK